MRKTSFLTVLAALLLFTCSVDAAPLRWQTVSRDVTLPAGIDVLEVDTEGGAKVVTLTRSVGTKRSLKIINKNGGGAVTINADGSETINGGSSYTLSEANDNVDLTSNGSGAWYTATYGATTPASVVAGGGYGSTGVTISSAGNIQANGTLTVDGASTLTGAVGIGGGYGSTGVSISAAGVVQANGALTVDGASTLTGAVAANGGFSVDTPAFVVADTSGNVSTTGTLSVTGASTLTGAVTAGSNVTVTRTLGDLPSASTGWISGVPKQKLVSLGTGTNGAAAGKTLVLMDDSPAGEFVAVDGDVVVSTDATFARAGSNSLKLAIAATADNTDGAADDYTGAEIDFSADESVGMWLYSTVALTAGDLKLSLTDSVAGETLVSIPAASANVWTWVEVNISAVADVSKDVINRVGFELSAAGAAVAAGGAFNVYIDAAYKWDADEEEALSTAILSDGVVGIFGSLTAAWTTPAIPVEYTDYFVHYESGSDFIVWITDQSATSNVAVIAY
jgi:hypothetical protein